MCDYAPKQFKNILNLNLNKEIQENQIMQEEAKSADSDIYQINSLHNNTMGNLNNNGGELE